MSCKEPMSASFSRRSLLAGLGAFGLFPRGAAAAESLTLSNAHLIIGDGTELDGGLRIEAGTLVEVGAGVKGGTDMKGATLWPGLWNGGSSLGLYEIDQEGSTHDESEGADPILPQARVTDAYNPYSEVIPVTRLGGVLGSLIVPGGGRLISGQAAWMRFAGNTIADTTILAPAGICINLGRGGANEGAKSRMGVALKLRDLFEANKPPTAEPAAKKTKKGSKEAEKPPLTAFQRAIHSLLRRETKALITADRASDLMIALDLAHEFNLDAVILGAAEGHLVAKELAAAGYPLLLGPVNAQPGGLDIQYVTCENPARLHRAGVKFAFRTPAAHNLRAAPLEAGVAVAYGLPREVAVAAACGNGPALWGMKVGMLKTGYEATFARCSGDPLQPRTATTGLWFQGVELPTTSRQTELYERFRTLK